MSKALTIARINLRMIKAAYIITGIHFLLLMVNNIIMICVPVSEADIVSAGDALVLLPVFAAIFIPAENYRNIINLGGKRKDFLTGTLFVYMFLSALVTLVMFLFYYVFNRFVANYVESVYALIEVFGFIKRGPVVAFIQMFAFLSLFAVFTHTLTAMQDKWYGWVTDVVLVAIISVFTPIAPLRSALVWFFRAIIFHQNALFQITFCFILMLAIYALSKPVLERKAI